jgi:hypothetical protein
MHCYVCVCVLYIYLCPAEFTVPQDGMFRTERFLDQLVVWAISMSVGSTIRYN